MAALMATLSACVVQPETAPALVDPTDLTLYKHPSGVFTLSVPADWVVNDRSNAEALNVEFSPPGSPQPVVTVYIVSAQTLQGAGVPPSLDDHTLDAYQHLFYSDGNATYKMLGRDLQADGSLRLKIVTDQPGITTQQNDFLQMTGPYLTALRVRLPDDPAQMRTLSRVVNTLTVDQAATWASLAQEGTPTIRDAISFSGLNTWVDRTGGFVIAGQVLNSSAGPLEFIRIEVRLYDDANRLLGEKDDFISSDLLQPDEYTPFSLSFPDGMPAGLVRYDLLASARYAGDSLSKFYGPGNFDVSSQADFDTNGFLVISGQIRNNGSQTADLVKVIVTVFDEHGAVIATDTVLANLQQLAPGAVSTYSVSFVELGGSASTFTVVAQGAIQR